MSEGGEIVVSELEALVHRLEARAEECRDEAGLTAGELPEYSSRTEGKAAGYELAASEVQRVVDREVSRNE